MRLFHKMFVAACLASAAAFPGLALADDVPPAIDAFLTNLENQTSGEATYENLKQDGDGNVTITNLTLTKPAKGEDGALTLTVAEADFSGISEEGTDHFLIGQANFADSAITLKGKDGDLTISIPKLDAEDWHIRATSDTPTTEEQLLASTTYAKQISTGPITLSAAGQSVTIDSVQTNWTGDPDTGAGTFNLKISNIALPEAMVAAMDQGGMLKQLGYSGLNIDIASQGDMTRNGDKLGYAFDVGITGRNIATLRFGAALNDIPLAAYVETLRAQTEGKEPNFDELTPQLQNVTLTSASVRFEDGSIFMKALPVIAAMQGIDEKTLVASIAPTIQMQLAQLQDEAFTKQVVDAVTAFLNDPKSLTVSAKPAAPLAVSAIGAMDPAKPAEAIAKLGLSITAND